MRQNRALQLVLIVVMLYPLAAAAVEGPRWSMSLVLGGHLPALSPLSDGLYRSPLVGRATVLVYEGQAGDLAVDENITEQIDFRFDNTAPGVNIATLAGVEFLWHANNKHSFIMGFGSMEKASIGRVIDNLPMQQYFVTNDVLSTRRDKISYTEYTLGWRYDFLRKKKFRAYSRLTVHEVFDIDFREDYSFIFIRSPIEDLVGVRRVMVAEAETAALFMGQVGVGGEWFLRDWMSLGVEGGWMIGERDFTLRHVRLRNDFLSNDNINLNGMPYAKLADGSLGYLPADATSADVQDRDTRLSQYRPMNLRFDGFRFLFRLSLYF